MNQQLIDYRLLKSGVMNERDYTLRRENYKTGTNTVFDLQKILQERKASTIDLYQKGEIQGLSIANMAEVEAYTDFANSKIDIDPYAPNINMSIYETKIIDGKEVRVIKKTSPVNVLKGQLLQTIPTFKLDAAVTKDVESLGVITDFLYDAATITRAGSITKLIGYGAIAGEYAKKDKDGNPLYPQFAEGVNNFISAVKNKMGEYFANPYHVSSVLTENTGNYGPESYIWDKEEAKKDKSKLLLKLDPLTGFPVLDKNAPHYKEHYQEVLDFTEKLILSKLDSKREFSTTSQSSQLRAVKDDSTPSGPPINVQEVYLSRVKEKTGLAKETFSNSSSETASNLQAVLLTIPGGNQFNVVPDNRQDGLVHLKDGDQIVKSFNVFEINSATQQKYLNEFTEIISNLAGTDGMLDYITRTGGLPQSGAGTGLPSR
jgi:hypothetical protein